MFASQVEARVLSTLLNEMDGVASEGGGRDGLLVVAATNRPQALDAALLRPGRFDNAMHVRFYSTLPCSTYDCTLH